VGTSPGYITRRRLVDLACLAATLPPRCPSLRSVVPPGTGLEPVLRRRLFAAIGPAVATERARTQGSTSARRPCVCGREPGQWNRSLRELGTTRWSRRDGRCAYSSDDERRLRPPRGRRDHASSVIEGISAAAVPTDPSRCTQFPQRRFHCPGSLPQRKADEQIVDLGPARSVATAGPIAAKTADVAQFQPVPGGTTLRREGPPRGQGGARQAGSKRRRRDDNRETSAIGQASEMMRTHTCRHVPEMTNEMLPIAC